MPEFVQQLADVADPAAGRAVTAVLTAKFFAGVLAFLRVAGLMTVGPVFGVPVVPANVRVLLSVAAALIVAPALPPAAPPAGVAGLLATGVTEFAVGFALGLGVLTILSGLQLAGELIDQQVGTALGEVFNPGLDVGASASGTLLYLLGTTVFLTLPPLDGHLRVFAALLETFRTLPPGDGGYAPSAEFFTALLHGSTVLALRVAAPTLAVMSLVALATGFLGRTVPQINVLVLGFPVRAAAGLLVLGLTLSPAGDVLVDTLDATLDALRDEVNGAPPRRAG